MIKGTHRDLIPLTRGRLKNLGLLGEALTEFGCDMSYLERGAEECDVTIRCYLLGQAISEVLDEVETVETEEKQKKKNKTNNEQFKYL